MLDCKSKWSTIEDFNEDSGGHGKCSVETYITAQTIALHQETQMLRIDTTERRFRSETKEIMRIGGPDATYKIHASRMTGA